MDVGWCIFLGFSLAFAWLLRFVVCLKEQTRAELSILRLREEQTREELVLLRSRAGRLVSVEALAKARRSVFTISPSHHEAPVGVGVFVAAGKAVTAAHNLSSPTPSSVFCSFGPADTSGAPAEGFRLRVVSRDDELDLAVLECEGSYVHQHFLSPMEGSPDRLVGESMALCAFQLALREDLPEFDASLGVMPAVGIKVSSAARHVVYSCSAWGGDSGGALLLHDGELVGIHLALVNALHETLDRKLDVEERLDSVEASLNELVRGVSNGCVALLASQFPN